MGAFSAPTIDYFKYFNYGPQRMLAGYTHIYHVFPHWSFVATCDAALNNCYSAAYTPDGTETFNIDPSGTPPGGVQNQVWQQFVPTYKATNIASNGNAAGHWTLNRAPTGAAVTITSTGTIRFFMGGGNYKNTHPMYLQNISPSGWPAGTTFRYWNGFVFTSCYGSDAGASGSYWNWGSNYRCTEVTIPADAAPGTYNTGWTFCADNLGNGCATISWPIQVVRTPTYTESAPSNIPALPAQFVDPAPCLNSNFQVIGGNCSFQNLAAAGNTDAQRGGAYWCSDTHNPDNFMELRSPPQYLTLSQEGVGSDISVWYYDGAKQFFNVANWFGDPKWANCARMIVSRYTQFGPGTPGVAGNPIGFNPGPYNTLGTSAYGKNWRLFPDGIGMGMAQFNDGVYSDAAVPNRWNARMVAAMWRLWGSDWSSPGNGGPSATIGYERETAYALNIATAMREHLGVPLRNPDGTITAFGLQYQRIADALCSIVLENFNPAASGPYDIGPVDYQSWMTGGLITEALRRYYEQSHDPRAVYLIKLLLDDIYAGYSYTAHAIKWMKFSDGPWCYGVTVVNNDPIYGWYIGSNGNGGCGQNNHPNIDGMVASIYAWWWRNFGGSDNTYQAFSDELATYSLVAGFGAPKDWNQVMRFSFDYLRWRQGR